MSAGPGARILVVDDTPANLKLLVDVLGASVTRPRARSTASRRSRTSHAKPTTWCCSTS